MPVKTLKISFDNRQPHGSIECSANEHNTANQRDETMTIARNHTDSDSDDFDCPSGYGVFVRQSVGESYAAYRDDDRFDAWEGDDEWADDWGYNDEPDWEDYADHLDATDEFGDEDYDDWCDRAESSDCIDPTIF